MPERISRSYYNKHYSLPKLENLAKDFYEKNKLNEPKRIIRYDNIIAASSDDYLLIFNEELIKDPSKSDSVEITLAKITKKRYNLIGEIIKKERDKKIKEEIELETIISHTEHFRKVLDDSIPMLSHYRYESKGEIEIKTERTDNNKDYWFIINKSKYPLAKEISLSLCY